MNLSLDAEALYADCATACAACWRPRHACWSASGPAAPGWPSGCSATWAAAARPASSRSTLHRDDFGARGLAAGADATELPFAIDGADILLIDDVLYTGRTIRAVVNELFDFGRPASVHAGGAGRPRRPRAADRSRASPPRRMELPPAQQLSAGARRRRPLHLRRSKAQGRLMLSRRNPQLNANGELIHLLSIEGLPRPS